MLLMYVLMSSFIDKSLIIFHPCSIEKRKVSFHFGFTEAYKCVSQESWPHEGGRHVRLAPVQ